VDDYCTWLCHLKNISTLFKIKNTPKNGALRVIFIIRFKEYCFTCSYNTLETLPCNPLKTHNIIFLCKSTQNQDQTLATFVLALINMNALGSCLVNVGINISLVISNLWVHIENMLIP
jgi:hypothetical protein